MWRSATAALRQAALMMLLAAVPALAAAWLHPSRPDPARIPQVEAAEVKTWKKKFLWVDARPRAEFQSGAIPGAVSLSEDDWDGSIDGFLDAWEKEMPVVVYCGGGDCGASESVARRLRKEAGITDVYVLKGGIGAWEKIR